MRSLNGVLGLLLVLVPGLAASCSGDETTGVAGGGGEGADAGESAQAGSKNNSGGKNNVGGTAATSGGQGGDAGEANGGTTSTSGGQVGLPEGGAGAGNAGAGNGGEAPTAGSAGENSGGAGGEAGAPSTPGPVIVFDAGPHNGLNFGGRLGLDSHCAAAKASKSILGGVTHALISVSASDEMRDMPALYGVPTDRAFVSPTGKQLADNWADLLDGSIDQSLKDAEVTTTAQFWISGSNTDGSVRSTCNGWTTSEFSQQVTGTYGYPGSKDSLWITITDGDVYCSASQYNVICLAY